MTKPKEYWIRKGTNEFHYKVFAEHTCELIGLDLGYGDDYYDAIVEEPAKNSIHVIEYEAYTKAIEALKEARIGAYSFELQGKEVYGGNHERQWINSKEDWHTHKALLINIEPIKKETAEEVLRYLVDNHNIMNIPDNIQQSIKAILNDT